MGDFKSRILQLQSQILNKIWVTSASAVKSL
mgnify:CR=1 FL=1|jgi:hypothetical protein